MKYFTLEYNMSNMSTMRCFGRRYGTEERRHLMGGLALQIIRQLELRFPTWTFRTVPYSTERDRYYALGPSSADGWAREPIERLIDEIAPLIYRHLIEYPEVIDQLDDRELALLHQTSRFPVHDQTAPDIFRTLVMAAQRVLPLNDVAMSASIWPGVKDGSVIISHYTRPDLRTSAHLCLGTVDLDCATLIHEIAHVLTMEACGSHPEHDDAFIDHLKRLLAALDDDSMHRLQDPVARQVEEADLGMQNGVEFFLWCGDEDFDLELAVQPYEDLNERMAWSYERMRASLPRRVQFATVWFDGDFVGVAGLPKVFGPDPIMQGLMDGTIVVEPASDVSAVSTTGRRAEEAHPSAGERYRERD